MDDLTAKLSELLESPDAMETVKNMASMFLGSSGEDTVKAAEASAPTQTNDGFSLPAISPNEIQMFMKLTGALKSDTDDDRSRLLMALRPHLSEKRKGRVDSAVKILKLVNIMPLLTEKGLF